MGREVRVGLVTACAGVLVASFLPWFGMFSLRLPTEATTLTAVSTSTAWNMSIGIPDLSLPNWLVVAAALLLALTELLGAIPAARLPDRLQAGLCLYGAIHLLLAAGGIGFWGLPGPGYLLSLGLYVYLLRQTVWSRGMEPAPAPAIQSVVAR